MSKDKRNVAYAPTDLLQVATKKALEALQINIEKSLEGYTGQIAINEIGRRNLIRKHTLDNIPSDNNIKTIWCYNEHNLFSITEQLPPPEKAFDIAYRGNVIYHYISSKLHIWLYAEYVK